MPFPLGHGGASIAVLHWDRRFWLHARWTALSPPVPATVWVQPLDALRRRRGGYGALPASARAAVADVLPTLRPLLPVVGPTAHVDAATATVLTPATSQRWAGWQFHMASSCPTVQHWLRDHGWPGADDGDLRFNGLYGLYSAR